MPPLSLPTPHGNAEGDLTTQEEPVDVERLATLLSALAYPTRLEILRVLRFPHTLGEIRVPAHRDAADHPDRPAAKQTVQRHLDTLMEAGLVRADPVTQGGKEVPSYLIVAQRLYSVLEEMRRLVLTYARYGTGPDQTGTVAFGGPAADTTGPRLVLVHGAYEGRTYPLAAGTHDGWSIGRRRGLAVSLDYDPYVTAENSRILDDGGRFLIEDLGSKNGTFVNWHPVGKSPVALDSGDVVGVGRSLLVFRGT